MMSINARLLRLLLLPVLVAIAFAATSVAQPPNTGKAQNLRDYIKENYTKRELMIPMRDGVKLFTVVYEPKDKSQKYPIMLNRTPFSVMPYGKDDGGRDLYKSSLGPDDLFAREGYIFAYQDVRGLWKSEGEFVHLRPAIRNSPKATDESTDAYDTVDWLVRNVENNNGRVGLYGVSYPGFYALAGIIDSHPAIKAASPQAPITDCFRGDDFHRNGALFLAQNFSFYAFFNEPRKLEINSFSWLTPFELPTEDGYNYFLRLGGLKNVGDFYRKTLGTAVKFWDEVAAHPNYDRFWKDRNILPKLKNIKTPVMIVGGWYDNEDLYGTLRAYQHIEAQNPGIDNVLVIGPWAHNSWARVDGDWLGTAYFGGKTAADYRARFELPFFNFHLKDKGDISNIKEVTLFDTGANEWRNFAGYHPKETKPTPLYLSANGRLSLEKPSLEIGFDEYVSDPLRPVPYTQKITMYYPPEYMTEDQRFAASRPDVLVYQTEPLTADITVAGDIEPNLFVSSTGTDADFVVKLIDVFPDDYQYPATGNTLPDGRPERVSPPGDFASSVFQPGGYQMLLRGEPMPARFRNGFERPEPLKPGVPAKVSFVMPGVAHTFKAGHRIMVQIQSTWFPLVARNPQKFVANYKQATDADFQTATARVYRAASTASNVILPVLK
jgi:uncharacterized protein